ncbi:formate dehydrogenase accessory sulfurtransferase FdhD [Thermus islandicus]|uniref:formate dehydrogenase accessory sulfurtransferase FdhD n=1 Tax=Thermus islandicus TaxID=540988 RepID=UPI0003B3ED35|nr:formate dehydrogenase accessory sulfurtransferase FdhD [Thermus islandicus]
MRLRLLRLNTLPPLDPRVLEDVEALKGRRSRELRLLGRLPYPMLRRKGERGFRRVSWDEALGLAADYLRRHLPDGAFFYLTRRGTPNETYYAVQKAVRALGSNHVVNPYREPGMARYFVPSARARSSRTASASPPPRRSARGQRPRGPQGPLPPGPHPRLQGDPRPPLSGRNRKPPRSPAMRGKARVQVARLEGGGWREVLDEVAVEAPLELRLRYREEVAPLGVILRTPGQDVELAAGFLYTEGLVRDPKEILAMAPCTDGSLPPEERGNVLQIFLRHPIPPFRSAACGACGRGELPDPARLGFPALLLTLPERLFRSTGGLHAAALFDREGRLLALREDVGRHNALDKLIGWAFLEGKLPLHDHLLLVSGRAGYELLVKAVAAGIPVFCAVSAPSSLAVAVAQAYGLTLVGFLRPERMNVYTGLERLRPQEGPRP